MFFILFFYMGSLKLSLVKQIMYAIIKPPVKKQLSRYGFISAA